MNTGNPTTVDLIDYETEQYYICGTVVAAKLKAEGLNNGKVRWVQVNPEEWLGFDADVTAPAFCIRL